jgi:tetratricopeptide (TPR) repeat protein
VQAQSLNNASLIYQNLGNYNLAYTTFTKALDLAKLTGNRRGESIVTANLGWIAGLLGDYEQSVKQLSRSIEIAKETGDIYSHAFALINLSLFKTSQKDFTNAEKFVTQALHALEEVGHTPGVAVAWTYLGHAQLGQKKMDDAKNSYQQAQALFQNLELKTLMMEPLAGISEITRREEGPHEAMTYVGQILEFLKSGGSLLEIDQPFRVYTICSKVMLEIEHPEAEQFIEDAYHLLMQQADKIVDKNWQHSYLNDVPCHREMIKIYQQVHAY